jgi:hypothetical protein
MLVLGALLRGEWFVAAHLPEHVVHTCQCQLGVSGLLTFAVGVEVSGESANAFGDLLTRTWKRERVKATSLVVANGTDVRAQRSGSCFYPSQVHGRRKHAQNP